MEHNRWKSMWKMYETKVIYEIHTIQRAKVIIFDSVIHGQKAHTQARCMIKPPKEAEKKMKQKRKHKNIK